MLDQIRVQINKNRYCMLMDGDSLLPLCIVPYFDCDDDIMNDDSIEYGHKAPVLLDGFNQNYSFEWDLTVKRVRKNFYNLSSNEIAHNESIYLYSHFTKTKKLDKFFFKCAFLTFIHSNRLCLISMDFVTSKK